MSRGSKDKHGCYYCQIQLSCCFVLLLLLFLKTVLSYTDLVFCGKFMSFFQLSLLSCLFYFIVLSMLNFSVASF